MKESAEPVKVVLRIPGKWAHPKELVERLPADCRMTPEALILPDETQVEFDVREADDQFADIFRSSCRRPATKEELATVNAYTVNFILKGHGGSLAAARKIMEAGAAVVRAGGAGVFIDNSALAHGGADWLEMTQEGSADAVSFAFVSVFRGKADVRTMGMHVLGFPDIVMKRADVEVDGFDIVEVIRYLCQGEKPVDDGHIVADLDGPRFRVVMEPGNEVPPDSSMHNPFGRMKLVSMRDIAETN